MTSTRTAALAAILSSASSLVAAFTNPAVTSSATTKKSTTPSSTSIYSTVDPSVVTKKEYQDICGVDFDDRALSDRLKKTSYLYPKHVEVIEDFEPLVNKMVDDIVSVSEWNSADRFHLDTWIMHFFLVTRNHCTLSPLTALFLCFWINSFHILNHYQLIIQHYKFVAPRNWREGMATTGLPPRPHHRRLASTNQRPT